MPGEAAPRLVWVTRAEPGAAATAQRLTAMGYAPVVSPLLTVESIAASLELQGVDALAFTSANGVRAFAAETSARGLPVYAVGDATADAARAAGFAEVASADGDVHALSALLAQAAQGRVVLHAGPEERAGDLTPAGVEVRNIALYRTVEIEPLAALARFEQLDAVLLHSPKAARALERLMAARAAPRLHAIAISRAAAEPLKHLDLASVAAAPLPNEPALLNLLGQTIRP